jgi:hypothetical protein
MNGSRVLAAAFAFVYSCLHPAPMPREPEAMSRPVQVRTAATDDAAHEAQLAAWRSERAYRIPALSARLCAYDRQRQAIRNEIAREKRYAADVGVVNLSKLEQLKIALEQVDDAATAQRTAFDRAGVAPLRCDEPAVTRLIACVGYRPPPEAVHGRRIRPSARPTICNHTLLC